MSEGTSEINSREQLAEITLAEITDGNLPPRYEAQLDNKGRTFYLDHEKETTSWLNPVKVAEFNEQDRKGIDLCFRRTTADGLEYMINYITGYVHGPQMNGGFQTVFGAGKDGLHYLAGFENGRLDVSLWPDHPGTVQEEKMEVKPPQYVARL
jgi:hypothetical protein